MDPNLLIPLLLFGGSDKRTADIIKRTLPVALPGQSGQRFALAAFVADRELKRQEQAEQQIIQEVVKTGNIKDSDALATKFPVHHALYVKLPAAMQASIVFSVDGGRPEVGARKS
jgi:hypothetical protein